MSRYYHRAAAASAIAVGAFLLFATGGAYAETQPAAGNSPAAGATPAPSDASTAPPTMTHPHATGADAPNALTPSGYIRMYDFERHNEITNASNPNRSAFNLGGSLQLDYHLGDSPFHAVVGGFAGDPFGLNGTLPGYNAHIDNSLPGFSYATLGIANLRYDDHRFRAVVGDQLFESPWTPSSDSRLKPALYQGIDAKYALDRHFDVGLSRMIAFESRTSSNFERDTLITDAQETNQTASPAGNHPTSGFLVADALYHNGSNAFASVYDYSFYNIANLTYVEAGGALDAASRFRPTISAQYVQESQAGDAVEGKIDNDTYGVKLASDLEHHINLALCFDDAPYRYADFTAASASAATTAAGKAYWLPGGGNGTVASLGGGLYRVAYGGLASPYTDSYASDPIYTTSISQGIVDLRSAGPSYKAALTFTSDNKRVKAIVSEAYYDYSDFAKINHTTETDVDVTYYFSPPKKGPYHGLLYRERFANRIQPTAPDVFTYVRSQLQYQF